MKRLLVVLMALFSLGLQAQDVTGTWVSAGAYKAELFQDGQNVYGIYNISNYKHYLSGRFISANQLEAQVVRINMDNNCRTTMTFRYTLNGNTLSGNWTGNDSNCDLQRGQQADESISRTTASSRPMNPFGGSAFNPTNDVTGSWSWGDGNLDGDWLQDNQNVYLILNGSGYKQYFRGTRSGNQITGQLIRYNPSGCRMILNQTYTQTDANTMQYSWVGVGNCDVRDGQTGSGTITRRGNVIAPAVQAGTYTLTNKNSNLCLAVRGATQNNGEETTQWACDGNADKNWKIIDAGGGYYKLQNKNSNHFLAVGAGSRDQGGRVVQYVDQGQEDILWRFIDVGGGYYKVQNKNSGLFLAIGAGSREPNANLVQWGDAGQEDIKWKLDKLFIRPFPIDIVGIYMMARVYPNPNFGGTEVAITEVGRKTVAELGTISSIKVAWGYKAIVTYERIGKNGAITTNQMEIVGDRETLPVTSDAGASAGRSSVTAIEIVAYTPLSGFVDMHTHPAAQLGFGKELFHGDNDGNIASALGNCNCKHNYIQKVGFFEPSGYCAQQNFFRNKLVDNIDAKYKIPVHIKGGGYPDFTNWPRNRSVLHQQMWWEWIKRAKDGGLKVMVALAVNSHILADAAETSGSYDDEQAIEDQITSIKQLAANHTNEFEIAYSPSDLRRIVQSGRLAIILGTETDNIGNFYAPAYQKPAQLPYNPTPRNEDIVNEINKLWDLGVRYIFPIHITDNAFGGAAIYETGFNAANKYNTGRIFNPEVVNTSETGIGFQLGSGGETISNAENITDVGSAFEYLLGGMYDEASNFFNTFGINANILPNQIMPNVRGNYPQYPNIGAGRGHRNSLGLTATGQFAINYMMKKGMMIDIDHMSEKAANQTLDMATNYQFPVNSGHNGLRGSSGTENNRTVQQLTKIKNLGGLFGLGHGGEASKFVEYYREALQIMDYKQLCIGTDANGLYLLPDKPVDAAKVKENYDNGSLTKSQTGTQPWDYDEMGMAHYGLFPDFIQSLTNAGMTDREKKVFFSSAEYFAQMWEKCERQRNNIR